MDTTIPKIENPPAPPAAESEQKPAEPAGRRPGRPTGSKTKPKMPAAPGEPPPPRHGNEKPPPLLTPDSRAAGIRREGQRLQALIDAEKAVNPEAVHWRSVDTLFQRTGSQVKRSAWRPFVALPVRLAERLAGVENATPRPARVTDEEIEEAASHWEAASVHLGLSEAGAAWLGAVGSTLATVGVAVARALSSWWAGRGADAESEPPPKAEP